MGNQPREAIFTQSPTKWVPKGKKKLILERNHHEPTLLNIPWMVQGTKCSYHPLRAANSFEQ
jgi:hypothetical protein